jgi:glycosyltransferase involved in cell wall biosynthesis
VTLSVVLITHNEEANLGRTLASVQPLVADGKGEIIVVDSGSADRTVEIANSYGAKVFVEDWKGYAAQKNSAIEKATGDWILSLDADEEVEQDLAAHIGHLILGQARNTMKDGVGVYQMTVVASTIGGFWIPRKNEFLGRWIKYGGFWPDSKLRLFRKGSGRFEDRAVHEDVRLSEGRTGRLEGALLHHSYPTLADYIDHVNRYSSLGAEAVAVRGRVRFSAFNIVVRPAATFLYNYVFRFGFLDGREGLLLHLYHAVYVSWKYAKAWELARQRQAKTTGSSTQR